MKRAYIKLRSYLIVALFIGIGITSGLAVNAAPVQFHECEYDVCHEAYWPWESDGCEDQEIPPGEQEEDYATSCEMDGGECSTQVCGHE